MYVFDVGTISLTGSFLTWKINNFFSLPLKVGCEISSEQFVYGDSRYGLNIWPRGRKGGGVKEWFGICLNKYNSPGVGDSVQFSIVTATGNIKTCTVECSENNNFWLQEFIEWSDFCTLSHTIAPLGCLTVVCRLPVQKGLRSYKENDNFSEVFKPTLNSQLIKFQSGDYHSPDPLSTISSFKLSSQGKKISSFEAPGYNCGQPSTLNSFFSASAFENSSSEYMPESTETHYSNFKMPYDAKGTKTENRITSVCTCLGEPNKNKPETSQGAARDNLQNASSKAVYDTRKHLPNASKSPDKSYRSEVTDSSSGFTSAEKSCPQSVLPGELSTSAAPYLKGLTTLSQHFKNIYLARKEFDLTIIMQGKEFPVLTSIVKSRSPFFDRLLSDNVDRNTSIPAISIDPFDDCDSSVFHEFLIYVYSGVIENLSHKNICGLYCAACKFEMPFLKEECMTRLKMSMSAESVTDIFRLFTEESELVKEAELFLAKNLEVIIGTDEWKQFLIEKPDRAISHNLKALKIGYNKKTFA